MSGDWQGVDLEIFEEVRGDVPILKPNRVRLNGVEVILPADATIEISKIRSRQTVDVTLTMMVRSLSIHREEPASASAAA